MDRQGRYSSGTWSHSDAPLSDAKAVGGNAEGLVQRGDYFLCGLSTLEQYKPAGSGDGFEL